MPPGFARERVCVAGTASALTPLRIYRGTTWAMLALLAAFALAVPPIRPAAQVDALARRSSSARSRRGSRASGTRAALPPGRHYGLDTLPSAGDPHVIVEHLTVLRTRSRRRTTRSPPPHPDVELHELPGVCSHFVVGREGTIVAVRAAVDLSCRHTVGLNWTAFGIQHVGARDSGPWCARATPAQLLVASLRPTRWLRSGSGTKGIIGHNESLTSPYHRA